MRYARYAMVFDHGLSIVVLRIWRARYVIRADFLRVFHHPPLTEFSSFSFTHMPLFSLFFTVVHHQLSFSHWLIFFCAVFRFRFLLHFLHTLSRTLDVSCFHALIQHWLLPFTRFFATPFSPPPMIRDTTLPNTRHQDQ